MANKVSVEISANTTAFVSGMNKADASAKAYETDMRKVSDYVTSFNKQLAASKREVKDLSKAWVMLDDASKNSAFGKRMKTQLEQAEKEAAKWIDMNGDIQEKLKNMASDTAVFDSMARGVSLAGNAFAATTGTIAMFTGDTKAAQEAVVAFTTAQSALTTVTQLANTAQSVFNKTCKSNVYVAVAAGVIALVAAIYKFVKAQKESSNEVKKAHELAAQRKQDEKDIAKDVATSASKQLAAYIKLQQKWKECGNDVNKQKIFIKNYAGEIKQTGFEVNSLSDAENLFVRNTNAVVESIMARAQAQASYNMMVKELERGLEKLETQTVANGGKYVRLGKNARWTNLSEEEKQWLAKRQRTTGNNLFNTPSYSEYERTGGSYYELTEAGIAAINNKRIDMAVKANKLYRQTIMDQTMQNVRKYKDAAIDAYNNVSEINKKYGFKEAPPAGAKTDNKKPKNNGGDPVALKGSLEALEKELSDLQEKAHKGILPPELRDPEKYKAKIEDLNKQIRTIKITLGEEEPLSRLEELENDLAQAQATFTYAVDTDDAELKEQARQLYLNILKKIEDYKESITIQPNIDFEKIDRETKEKVNTIIEDLNKQMNDALASPKQSSFNQAIGKPLFEDGIKGIQEQMDMNDKLIESLNKLAFAYAAMGDAGVEGLLRVFDALDKVNKKQLELGTEAKTTTENTKKLEEQKNTLNKISSAASTAASMFRDLSSASEEDSLKAAGIITEAIANVIAGYAAASGEAGKIAGPWGWAAFSLAGLAQIISVISQLHSLSGYAEGGVIGGHSYTGDRLLARVNSGEAILNRRQQANALALMDQNTAPNKIYVEGKIRGTDLLLVQKNTNIALSKAGSAITFQ